MNVKVELFTILKKYGKGKLGKDGIIDVSEECSLGMLSKLIEIPEQLAKVYLINGMPKGDSYRLRENDNVKILTFIGGGAGLSKTS